MLTVARLVHVISVQKTNQGIHAAGQLRLNVDAMAGPPLEALDHQHVAPEVAGLNASRDIPAWFVAQTAAPAYTGAEASTASSSMNTFAVSCSRVGLAIIR